MQSTKPQANLSTITPVTSDAPRFRKSKNFWLTALSVAVCQTIATVIVDWVALLHLHVNLLDILLSASALLVLVVFEAFQRRAGRTTPLAAFFIRFSRAQ